MVFWSEAMEASSDVMAARRRREGAPSTRSPFPLFPCPGDDDDTWVESSSPLFTSDESSANPLSLPATVQEEIFNSDEQR